MTIRYGSIPAFAPTAIPLLKLWLKADAGTFQDSLFATPSTADGDAVGGWQDQSGNVKHVVQATSTKRGTLKTGANGQNGKPVVRGDGVDDILASATVASALTDNFTFFIAYKNRGAANSVLLNNGTSVTGYLVGNDGTNRTVTYGAVVAMSDGAKTANFTVYSFKREAGTATLRANAVSEALTNSTATPNTPVTGTSVFARNNGAGDFFCDCDIAEVLLYDAALSAGEITSVETYLNARWAAF